MVYVLDLSLHNVLTMKLSWTSQRFMNQHKYRYELVMQHDT